MLELAFACNLKCRTCNIWRQEFEVRRRASGRLDFNEICDLQSRAAASGIRQISYVGGEPLLDQNIWEIIDQARQNRLSTALVTNGSLLDERSINRLLDSGLDTVIFSLDGPARIHDTIRGVKGTFHRVFQNILTLQRIKKVRKRKRPKVFIYTTISRLNHRYLTEMLAIARKLDVNGLRFQLISVVGGDIMAKTNELFSQDVVGLHSYAVSGDLRLREAELAAVRPFLDRAGAWSKAVGIDLQVETGLSQPDKATRCTFIHHNFVVNPGGDLIPCPMLPGYTIGSLRQENLEALWGNERHRRFFRLFQRPGHLPICAECCVEKMRGRAAGSGPGQAV